VGLPLSLTAPTRGFATSPRESFTVPVAKAKRYLSSGPSSRNDQPPRSTSSFTATRPRGHVGQQREEALKLMRGLEALARSAGTSAAGGDVLSGSAGWRAPRGYDEHPVSSELVRVLLWEDDTESA
jgi:hypothetical protein